VRTARELESGEEILSDIDILEELERWYQMQCDGEWEHGYGVRIDTLDNPGWSVDIDLRGTDLSGAHLPPTQYDRPDAWLRCEIVDDRFVARCGPLQLREALRIFVDLAISIRRTKG
jgi:hypothetical protein